MPGSYILIYLGLMGKGFAFCHLPVSLAHSSKLFMDQWQGDLFPSLHLTVSPWVFIPGCSAVGFCPAIGFDSKLTFTRNFLIFPFALFDTVVSPVVVVIIGESKHPHIPPFD